MVDVNEFARKHWVRGALWHIALSQGNNKEEEGSEYHKRAIQRITPEQREKTIAWIESLCSKEVSFPESVLAQDFAEWCSLNDEWFDHLTKTWYKKWSDNRSKDRTTAQLMEIYLTEKEQ